MVSLSVKMSVDASWGNLLLMPRCMCHKLKIIWFYLTFWLKFCFPHIHDGVVSFRLTVKFKCCHMSNIWCLTHLMIHPSSHFVNDKPSPDLVWVHISLSHVWYFKQLSSNFRLSVHLLINVDCFCWNVEIVMALKVESKWWILHFGTVSWAQNKWGLFCTDAWGGLGSSSTRFEIIYDWRKGHKSHK